MRVISHKRLKDFWEDPKSPQGSERYLAAWYKLALAATWRNFAELRATFGSADAVGDCVVFDVGNNRIRLIGRVRYVCDELPGGRVYVLAVLRHAEYDENKWPDDCGCHEPPPPPKKKARRVTKRPGRKK